ncbi:MAG: hypothetical protein ACLU3I_17400 [Acutalibacteraceae bacterium]
MNAEQALQALRDLTLDGSIRLMHTLSTDQTLEQLLEQAKGEKISSGSECTCACWRNTAPI